MHRFLFAGLDSANLCRKVYRRTADKLHKGHLKKSEFATFMGFTNKPSCRLEGVLVEKLLCTPPQTEECWFSPSSHSGKAPLRSM